MACSVTQSHGSNLTSLLLTTPALPDIDNMIDQQSIQLDHIVVLLSYLELLNLPTWITANFTVSPGGRHADGKTENKLILFQDGTYIELIAFVHDDPANRRDHWWGDKRYGVIDWALTSSTVEHANRAAACLREWKSKHDNEALADFAYTQPRQGGRRKPDGQEIAWFVTFPRGVRRGLAPFWCHDSTPRQLRVPIDPQGLQHQCGAIGISNLIVHTPVSAALQGAYDAILAQPGGLTADDTKTTGPEWTVESPRPSHAHRTSKVSLRPLDNDKQLHDVDAEIRIELAVGSGGETQIPGPISGKVGLHGEGQINISFVRTERNGP